MPDSVPVFFTATDPLDINTLLSLTGENASQAWITQGAQPQTSQDRGSGLKANGDEAAWKSYNKKTTLSVPYECHALTGFLTLPKVGSISGGFHIDSVALAYQPNGWPKMTVNAHAHAGAATHTAVGNKYSTGLKFPAQWGIPSILNNLATPAVAQFALTVATIGMKGLSYNLTATHVDEPDGVGEWLAGENRDGEESLDAEFTGIPLDAELTIAATWHKGTDGAPNGNTAVNSRKLSLVRHVARDAA